MSTFEPQVLQLESQGLELADHAATAAEEESMQASVSEVTARWHDLQTAANKRQVQLQMAVEQLVRLGRMADAVTAWSDEAMAAVGQDTVYANPDEVLEHIKHLQVG